MPFAGSMIERIVAICATKADSLKWIECLQHQIKVARQPTAHQATPSHVSLREVVGSPTPPYQLLSRDGRTDSKVAFRGCNPRCPELESVNVSLFYWRSYRVDRGRKAL